MNAKYICSVSLAICILSCKSKIAADSDSGKDPGFSLHSPDTTLVNSFRWAKNQALQYVGDNSDTVGPWYEAALPGRQAFCMRDVSHQSIGGEILGLSAQNFNMFEKFAANISESKDWCSYWEIDKDDHPAPADYKNDREFWYNLPANFDLIRACWREFCWTGNKSYIDDEVFRNFYEKSLKEYVERWQLQPERIMSRPKIMNLPADAGESEDYHRCCRGIPSYVETDEFPIAVGADLIASLFAGFLDYSKMLEFRGDMERAREYKAKAMEYQQLLNSKWWAAPINSYQTFWNADKGEFYKGEGELFLLWFGVLQNPDRIKATFSNLQQQGSNVESRSYLPFLYTQYGFFEKAYDLINALSDPAEERRSYPEVSFGVMEGIVSGLMGVGVYAPENKISTCPKLSATPWAELRNLEVMGTTIDIKHIQNTSSVLLNKGNKDIIWKALFPGHHKTIEVNGAPKKASYKNDKLGNPYSFVEIPVKGNSRVTAEI